MRAVRIILLSVLAMCIIIFVSSAAASAATAKPATAYAVPATTCGVQSHAAMFSLLPAGSVDYPHVIGPRAVNLHSQTVAPGTYNLLHVCPEWATSSADLSLKVYEPDGTPILFELADGRVVYDAHDADDGVIDRKINFYISNDDGSYLQGGDWTYELTSHLQTESVQYRI